MSQHPIFCSPFSPAHYQALSVVSTNLTTLLKDKDKPWSECNRNDLISQHHRIVEALQAINNPPNNPPNNYNPMPCQF